MQSFQHYHVFVKVSDFCDVVGVNILLILKFEVKQKAKLKMRNNCIVQIQKLAKLNI